MTHKISRREFIKAGSGGAVLSGAGLLAGGLSAAMPAEACTTRATLDYPEVALGQASALAINAALSFSFPDPRSPCALIRMGYAIPGGVGPDRDIIAYSILCSHMGCPVAYDPASRNFKCPCHFCSIARKRVR